MRVRLVADIPDDFILRRFEDSMERERDLYGTQARSEMASVFEANGNDLLSNLFRESFELLDIELFQVLRQPQAIEQHGIVPIPRTASCGLFPPHRASPVVPLFVRRSKE